jgi:hypothetical protein
LPQNQMTQNGIAAQANTGGGGGGGANTSSTGGAGGSGYCRLDWLQ